MLYNSVQIILIVAVTCIAQSKVSGYDMYPGFYVYGTGLRYATSVNPVTGGTSGTAPGIPAANSGTMVAAASGTYHKPLAYPVVLPNGFLLDTPEVAAVKAAHMNAIRSTRDAIIRAGVAAAASGAPAAYGSGAGVYGNGGGVYAPGAGVYAVPNYGNGQYAYQG